MEQSKISQAILAGSSDFAWAVANATCDRLCEIYGHDRWKRIWNGKSAASHSKVLGAVWHVVREYSDELKANQGSEILR